MQRLSRLLMAALGTALCGCVHGPDSRPGDGPPIGAGDQPRLEVKQDASADRALDQARESPGTPRDKVEAYLAVRKTYPSSTAGQEALYQAGVLSFEAGEYARARKLFNELLFENPLFEKAQDAKLK